MTENNYSQIKDLLTDFCNDSLDGIIISDFQYHANKYKKINVYNNNVGKSLQKIWIRTPKMKVFKPILSSLFNNNSQSISLAVLFSPNAGEIKKLYFFIKKLERHILTIIKNKTSQKNIKMKSSIKTSRPADSDKLYNKFPPIMNIKMPFHKTGDNCFDFLFNVYNYLNQRIQIDSINSGSYVSSYIELSEVWINEKKEFGFNWNILQLKIYPEFDFSLCLFDDEICDEPVSNNQQPNECFHCLYCPNKHVRTHQCMSHNICDFSSNNTSYLPPPPPPPMPPISLNVNHKKFKLNDNNKKKNLTTESPKGIAFSLKDILAVKLRPTKKKDDDNNNNINNNDVNINNKNDNNKNDNNNNDNNNDISSLSPSMDDIINVKNQLLNNEPKKVKKIKTSK